MDRIRIVGGRTLEGTIPIPGAKNAALPLMIAALLTGDTLTLENIPNLADVNMLLRILGHLGVDYSVDGRRPGEMPHASRTIHLSARAIVDTTRPMSSFPNARELLGGCAASRQDRRSEKFLCRVVAQSARGLSIS